MRILLTNFGTIGDLQPLLSLAAELQRCGHEPLVAHSPGYRAQVEAAGIPFAPIGPDLHRTQQAINLAWTTEEGAPYSPTRMKELLGELVVVLPRVYQDLANVASDVDVICAGPAQPAARMVADTRNLPFVSLQVSNFGGIGSPALRLASAELINPLRQRLGLMPLRDPLTLDANSPELALYAMSPHVMPTPRSWPRHWHLTGFFFPPGPPRVPDASIVRVVEEGEPPVVITFGSMVHRDPPGVRRLLLEAIRQAGQRALIQDAEATAVAQLEPGVHLLPSVDHRWLLPRAACVVHHGGGGTAAAVFRAGVPSVFVPHGDFYDQTYWARLAHELGCAGPPQPLASLSAARLAAAIRRALDDDRQRAAAVGLGGKIRAELGVMRARQLIENLVATDRGRAQPSSPARAHRRSARAADGRRTRCTS